MDYKKVYVASPLSADTEFERQRNILKAQSYEDTIAEIFSCRSVAPHGYLSYILDDSIPQERQMALNFDKQILQTCDALVLCGDTITAGMLEEALYASRLGMPVYRYKQGRCHKLCNKALKYIVTVEVRR